jgi:hypothetical protein
MSPFRASAMSPHRLALGQVVTFSETRFPNLICGAECVIVRLLPTRYKGPEYLIRCASLASEIVVGEQELRAAAPSPAEELTFPDALAA